ncbi:hypothetical protein QNH10_06550 [Sporosarcina thermotolerans]|uniref:hypothetical protein n=1 Tax=Sporosarcina thermotolerans TaxID=633404 RepID=UPI0024BCEBEC|nr:hypothetical protein [Sporosarcina thermotolerans]WHT49267.1 hypothetical protein QNH10_06550 [Sporosarcina thermotolerans]
MFEEMKIRYLFALSVVSLLVLVVFTVGVGVNEEFFGAAANIVIYAIIPAIFFGYYFNKYPNVIRDTVFFKGIKPWGPAIVGIVIVSIVLSLSSFWLLVFVVDPILPAFADFLMTEVPMPTNPVLLVTEIIAITILGPIVEEFASGEFSCIAS